MSRVDVLYDYPKLRQLSSDRTIYRALVNCLEPEELCLLLPTHFDDHSKRNILLSRIAEDMKSKIENCHIILVKSLFQDSQRLAVRNGKSRISAILKLYHCLPTRYKAKIRNTYLDHSSVEVRRKIYKVLPAECHGDGSFDTTGETTCVKRTVPVTLLFTYEPSEEQLLIGIRGIIVLLESEQKEVNDSS